MPSQLFHRPVFLLGCHKSGTSLLRSLLDGHPNFAVVPFETHFFQYSGHWVDYPLRRSPHVFTSLRRARKQLEAYIQSFRIPGHADPTSDAPTFRGCDPDAFSQIFSSQSADSQAELLKQYLAAILASLPGESNSPARSLVEKSVEHAQFAPLLRKMFPSCRFLHIIRDPFATLVALRRAKTRRFYPDLGPIALSMRSSYVHLLFNMTLLSNYMVIRFEDLVRNPRTIMANVADFLEVPFHPTLLTPTSLGRSWHGNSSSRNPLHGISQDPLSTWRNHVTAYEAMLIDCFCKPVLQHFGYTPPPATRSRFLPNPKELPSTYLRNRLLLSTLARS